jgi:NADP-dependent 3-hydroxy acid dehydrogenase YdfG
MELKNKIAVITGVSTGIGKHCAEMLLAKGCVVYGLGRNNVISHKNYSFIPTDIRFQQQVDAAFDKIFEETEAKIHILINNAGLGFFGYLEEMPVEQWHLMYDTNVNGMFYCLRRALPSMKSQRLGHILNISSTAGLEGYQQVGGYCSTKFAVKGLSESLYKEVRDYGVKVTCVYPGSVKTEFFRNSPVIQPHDYMLKPEDLATVLIQALETPDNFHQVNLEVRPLMPKGPK